MIIDYSTWRPSAATLKAAGVTAVGRYIGWDGEPGFADIHKNLTRAEAKALLGAGIDIFLSFEYAADAALNGTTQGVRDAALATQQLHDLGAPAGMTVYFALDFDIRDYAPKSADPAAKLGPAAGYFHGIHSTKPAYEVGVYGGYYAVSRVMDAGLASMGWQTVAWSGGRWYAKAVLRQLAQQFMGESDVNVHGSSGDDFGQWPRPAQAPAYRDWLTKGHASLHEVGGEAGMTAANILTDTVKHYGTLDPVIAGYVNGVFARDTAKIPAGGVLRVRRS